jgi:hypothetical protein
MWGHVVSFEQHDVRHRGKTVFEAQVPPPCRVAVRQTDCDLKIYMHQIEFSTLQDVLILYDRWRF